MAKKAVVFVTFPVCCNNAMQHWYWIYATNILIFKMHFIFISAYEQHLYVKIFIHMFTYNIYM